MQPINPSGSVGNTPPVQQQGQVAGGQQQAPGLRSQSVEARPLLGNPFEPAHGNETEARQVMRAASAELLPLVTEGPSYDFIRSNFPVLHQKIEAWRTVSSADLTPVDVIGMQLTASQLTREIEKLQAYTEIMKEAASLVAGGNAAPGSKQI